MPSHRPRHVARTVGWAAFWFVVPIGIAVLLIATFRGPKAVGSAEGLSFEIQGAAGQGPFNVNLSYTQSADGASGVITEHAELRWTGVGAQTSKSTPISVYDDGQGWRCQASETNYPNAEKALADYPRRAVKGLIDDRTKNSAQLVAPQANSAANSGVVLCDLRSRRSFSSAPHVTMTSPQFVIASPKLNRYSDTIAFDFDPTWSVESTVPGAPSTSATSGSGDVDFSMPVYLDSPELSMTTISDARDAITVTNPAAAQLNSVVQQALLLVAGAWLGLAGGVLAPSVLRRPRTRKQETAAPLPRGPRPTRRVGSPRQRIGRRIAGRK